MASTSPGYGITIRVDGPASAQPVSEITQAILAAGVSEEALTTAKASFYKIPYQKINPKDVVSVPEDCACQKCRVCAYKVIDVFSQEIECPVCDEDGEEIINEDQIEYNEFETRIDNYLRRKYGQQDLVSVRAIQNSFSPEYPSKVRVLDALNTLDYTWIKDEDGNEQVLI